MTDSPGETTPVCYRHPGRETYVRCGRCERYICPDDMISAAVGFQCPECVAAGSKGVREARTVTGGRISANTGILTTGIIAINVVIFLLVQGSNELVNRLALRPFWIEDDGVAQGGWHRLLTAAFVHEETLHIALNMLALWLFGRPLEAALGRARFIATYLLCALGGSVASYCFLGPIDGSIGASGAVFGMVGALVVVDRQLRANPSGVVIYLAIMLLPGFLVESIDWRGHVGGLLTGALLGALFVYAPAANRAYWHIGGAVLLTVALLVVVQLRSERLKDQVRGEFFVGAPTSLGAAVIPTVENRCGELQPCDSGESGRSSATGSR